MPDAAGKPSLLIVDDDPLIAEPLSYFLRHDFDVAIAASRPEAIDHVRQAASPPAIALVDLGLPPTPHQPDEGFALVSELLVLAPAIQIVILSGQNDEANARHARALGAADFIAKPADPERLRQMLRRLLSCRAPAEKAAAAARPDLIGDSLPMQRLRTQLRQYANSPFPVLIEGESGSGKEIVAGTLHRLSERHDRPYLALNCAAIAPTLVEPTLFGHARGAFTGAAGARAGYFEDAADGTLFLDEIGELPLDLQPKLLRVLENGEYQRVGETQGRLSRARVIAATNRDLKREVREGRFRADLYHRLSVFAVSVPPLREMGDDRLLLLDHFRRMVVRQTGQAPFMLSSEAEARWRDYHFPGNVRELRNIVIRLATKHAGVTVSSADLEAELDLAASVAANGFRLPRDEDGLAELARLDLRDSASFSLDDTLRRWESAYIRAAQQLTHGNVSQAARLLGVNRTTLYNRMEALARDKGGTSD
ncbi:MAG: sigma-54 dependent transcriptional regulator [Candidatus Nitricoxidivorans perseverans]|uniref:Sigma-54 dependent transcriptional regulator n=1 Tax=Candidatus Nitricoxidivorans perseverans TaxID=2975601 RepID=A0AA49FMP5_9PROT|nr:MAG: sigma-54 dependent transcriptional regulator [Candidatus Nitricoxidivorans perseverans]